VGLGEAFTLGFWDVVNPLEAKQIGFYRPLVTLLFTAGWTLSGTEPWGYHLVNLLAHAAASLLVLALARGLGAAPGIAFAAALLFALHPIHTESVTWVSGISDVSCAVFFFAALVAHHASGGGPARRASLGLATAALAFLALLGKEMALVLLPVAFALDLATGRVRVEGARRRLAALLPVAVATAAYLVLRVHAFGEWSAGLLRSPTHLGLEAAQAWRAWTLPFELFAGYLRVLFLPFEPQTFRVLRFDLAPTDAQVLVPIAVGAAYLLFLRFVARRAGTLVGTGSAFLLVSSLPVVLRAEALGQFPLSERFAYIPSFGFCVALAAGVARLLGRRGNPRVARVGGTALAALSGIYALVVHDRNRDYRDEVAFFEAARERSPNSATVRWSLARVYAERAQRETDPRRRRAMWEAASAEVDASLAVDGRRFHVVRNDRTQANLLKGWIEIEERSPSTAEAIFRLVVEWDPQSPEAHVGLGAAAQLRGDLDAAEAEVRKALEIHPRHAQAWASLGAVFQARDDLSGAVEAFQEALEADPTHFDAAMRLGQALYHLGRRPEAAAAWEHALRADPDHPNAPLAREALAAVRAGR